MDEKKQKAVDMLKKRYTELGHLPKRSDFDPSDVCFIKQKLGPWPRALEEAGLKEKPLVSSKEKSKLKRQRRKEMLRSMKRSEKQAEKLQEEKNENKN